MKLLRIFLTALGISFMGTLPLGSLNIAAMQISASDGIWPAIKFSLGALIVEVIYVRVSLVAMDWVRKRKKLFKALEWITVALIAALSVSSFIAAADPYVNKNVILSNTLPRFYLGVMMSAMNPVQIPFWFGWSTVLFTKKILEVNQAQFNLYILGIGIGTFIGNLIFILGGRLIVDHLNTKQHILNYIIGGIFAITAGLLLFKMLKRKDMITEM